MAEINSVLISVHELTHSFGPRPLFEEITFSIGENERIGLIGPNGAGKSTLLRILAGRIQPDQGNVAFRRGLKVGYLEQVPQFTPQATVLDTVLEGSQDAHDGEEIARAYELLSKLSLSGEQGVGPESQIETLSGGWKKRVALARELLRRPELLLLDEPTNHLDVESILWLENFIARVPYTVMTITHDRVFLQRVSNRILELDRRNEHGLLSVNGDYSQYLEIKQQLMSGQEEREVRMKNLLRRETEWLRRGAKARTTKQQARITRAGELGDEVADLTERNRVGKVQLDFDGGGRHPKKLLEAQGISKRYGDQVVVPPIDLLITPKSRIGLLGPNGCGKSTLIRLLLGVESPDTGTVTRSDALKPLYFEQNRESLNPEFTLMKTLCPSGDHVLFNGRSIHVRGYLDRFLFSRNQLEMAVGKLSGGEQSRLLLAQLMLREGNLLILDEPTNDLDLATLDVLEEVLNEYGGAVLLVTHDRYFLDQVARQILAFGHDPRGNKTIVSLSGLEQWENWYEGQERERRGRETQIAQAQKSAAASNKKKLSYKDQREWDQMESIIHTAESRLKVLQDESNKPEVMRNVSKLTELGREMSSLEKEIERLYARWDELSKLQ